MPQTGLDITGLVAQARAGSNQARNDVLNRLKPFAGRIAVHTTGRSLAWENDDELGVALSALNEAIDAFDPRAGAKFESFAAQVIRRRLIDHARREVRYRRKVLSLDDLNIDPATPVPPEGCDLPLAVEALKRELRRYGLGFSDLVRASPKHRDTRETLIRAARALAADPEMRQVLETQRRLPLTRLMQVTGLSRRVLERGRRYIIAIVLILAKPEFYPLRSFAGLNTDSDADKR